jgi:hypothetical protein
MSLLDLLVVIALLVLLVYLVRLDWRPADRPGTPTPPSTQAVQP